MESKYEKLRELNESEMFYEIAQRDFNFMISSYWLKLSSKEKLKSEDLEKALRILYRSFDSLSLCIREEEGKLWFCRMKKEAIDFEVINNKSAREVLEEGKAKNFQSTIGPLWRVKFIIDNAAASNRSSEASCESVEWPSDIILSIDHGITDGSTTIRICSAFLKILNDVISGSEKEVYDCFGKFSDDVETELLVQQRKEFFENNPLLYERIKAEMLELSNEKPILEDIFPLSIDVIKTTKHIVQDLDRETTSKLINKFKTEGITFHAGFTAVANWALMDILTEHGYNMDTLDIGELHDINMRRYWSNSAFFQQGCHIGAVRMLVPTDKNVGNNFWPYAKSLHNTLKNYLSEGRPLDEMITFPVTSSSGSIEIRDLFRDPPSLQFYFCTSNMGDLTPIFNDNGEHVTMNWITRCTPCHNWNISFVHIMQTFQGKFMYGLDYSTNYVRDDLAEKYVVKIFKNLKELVT